MAVLTVPKTFLYTYLHLFTVPILSDPNGVITSPGYPENYPNYIESGWLIQLPLGQFIEVPFSSFELESDSICR